MSENVAPKLSGGGKSAAKSQPQQDGSFSGQEKQKDVRASNIAAAKAIADTVRSSLGPRGMDKMLIDGRGEVTITNDGATILSKLQVYHPAARMLVDLSKSQDVEAGDGTTSVVVLAGALLGAAQKLLDKGIHPAVIARSFLQAEAKGQEVLRSICVPLVLSDRESLLKSATTSLNSKVVNQYSSTLAPIAVDAVLKVINPETADSVELRDIRVVKKLGGTVEDTELVDGIVFTQRGHKQAGNAPTSVENAKIALIQFCISPPKTNVESTVVISDYTQMDRHLREERSYLLRICKAIQKTGANVVLVQKSILRDAVTDMSMSFLAKLKIMVVTDIERSDIEFISKTLGCSPIASVEALSPSKLGRADLVASESTSGGKIVRITGVPLAKGAVSVLVRGSNPLVVDEAERSLHDALCVIRSLVKCKFMAPGGGAPEIELSLRLAEYAKTLGGLESYCVRGFAEALEVIPYTLAENSGLHPIDIVTSLRKCHADGQKTAGINVRKGTISDILLENIVQPLLVSSSALTLASETVALILKIDDILHCR